MNMLLTNMKYITKVIPASNGSQRNMNSKKSNKNLNSEFDPNIINDKKNDTWLLLFLNCVIDIRPSIRDALYKGIMKKIAIPVQKLVCTLHKKKTSNGCCTALRQICHPGIFPSREKVRKCQALIIKFMKSKCGEIVGENGSYSMDFQKYLSFLLEHKSGDLLKKDSDGKHLVSKFDPNGGIVRLVISGGGSLTFMGGKIIRPGSNSVKDVFVFYGAEAKDTTYEIHTHLGDKYRQIKHLQENGIKDPITGVLHEFQAIHLSDGKWSNALLLIGVNKSACAMCYINHADRSHPHLCYGQCDFCQNTKRVGPEATCIHVLSHN